MRQNHRRGQALVRRTSVRFSMVSAQHILRSIDAGREVRRPPLIGMDFLYKHGKRLKYHRKGQRASSPSSLIGLPDHSGIFPAARSHCASSRHPESRRSGCAADSGQLSARQLPCQFYPRAKRWSADTTRLCRVRAGSRCNGVHFKGTTASGVFLPDTTQHLPSSAGTVSEEHRGLYSHRRPKPLYPRRKELFLPVSTSHEFFYPAPEQRLRFMRMPGVMDAASQSS
jgi:hypothetical protein